MHFVKKYLEILINHFLKNHIQNWVFKFNFFPFTFSFFFRFKIFCLCVMFTGKSSEYESEIGDLQREANDAENAENHFGTTTEEMHEPIYFMQP